MAERDLVERLWHALHRGVFQITQAKAHQQVASHHSELDIYDILGNALADEAANSACKYMAPDISLLADEMYRDITLDQKHRTCFYECLLALRKHYAILQVHERESRGHELLQPDAAPTPAEHLIAWTVEEAWQAPQPGVCFLFNSHRGE